MTGDCGTNCDALPAGLPPAPPPLRFLAHYVAAIRSAMPSFSSRCCAAVLCSVSTPVRHEAPDRRDRRRPAGARHAVWAAFVLLCGLIAADNLLWRVGGWAAARTFVAVTGDIRRDLFAHLSGHSPAYFAERLPGALASRITATANAAFTVENTGAWNVLPPCIAVICAIVPDRLGQSAAGRRRWWRSRLAWAR